jgi:Mn-dependent DtxR family transcriptional regulator
MKLLELKDLSTSEEDYIEMIYRLSQEQSGYTRVNVLAQALNIRPPSVSHMIKKLAHKELVSHSDYGLIELTPKGFELGRYLLDRHMTVENFLKLLGLKANFYEEAERIEHTISDELIHSLKQLVYFFEHNQAVLQAFKKDLG